MSFNLTKSAAVKNTLAKNSSRGFTLIESLVAIGIIGVIGFILVDLTLRSFRGSNKAQLIGVIKQNAQSVLNVLDQKIRYSTVVCVTGDSPAPTPPPVPEAAVNHVIAIRDRSGQYIRYRIYPPVGNASGYLTQDMPVVPSPLTGTLENWENVTLCAGGAPEPNAVNLTDQTRISLVSGSFTRVRDAGGGKDLVRIHLDIGPAPGAALTFDESVPGGSIPFETAIVLR